MGKIQNSRSTEACKAIILSSVNFEAYIKLLSCVQKTQMIYDLPLMTPWMQQRIATATACVSCVQVLDGRFMELVQKPCRIGCQIAGLRSSCLSLMHEDGQVCKGWPRCVKSMADLSAIGPFLRTFLPDFPGSCADSSTLYILRPAQKEPYFRWL